MPYRTEIIIQPFLDSLKFEKRYSIHTIRAYQDDLTQFIDYLALQFGDIEMSSVTSSFVRSWLASLKNARLNSKSIGRKLSTLRSFFKFQMRIGVINASLVAAMTAPKISKRLPAYVEQKDMATLLNGTEFPDTWNGKTDKLIVEILYNTGMRLSELVELKGMHVDYYNIQLKVLGKGNKERNIPVSTALLKQIKTYSDEKSPDADSVYLLVTANGKKLYHKYVYRTVNKYLKGVTTMSKRSPHVLRHTFATHLMNSGADMNSVKELLGHSSLAATQIYTHNTIEKLKEVHKKSHPKS